MRRKGRERRASRRLTRRERRVNRPRDIRREAKRDKRQARKKEKMLIRSERRKQFGEKLGGLLETVKDFIPSNQMDQINGYANQFENFTGYDIPNFGNSDLPENQVIASNRDEEILSPEESKPSFIQGIFDSINNFLNEILK